MMCTVQLHCPINAQIGPIDNQSDSRILLYFLLILKLAIKLYNFTSYGMTCQKDCNTHISYLIIVTHVHSTVKHDVLPTNSHKDATATNIFNKSKIFNFNLLFIYDTY